MFIVSMLSEYEKEKYSLHQIWRHFLSISNFVIACLLLLLQFVTWNAFLDESLQYQTRAHARDVTIHLYTLWANLCFPLSCLSSHSVSLSMKSVGCFASVFLHLSVKTELSCYNFYNHPIYFIPFNHCRIHFQIKWRSFALEPHFTTALGLDIFILKKTFQLIAIGECKHIIYTQYIDM